MQALIAAPLPDPTLLSVSATIPWDVAGRPPWRRRLKRFVVVLLCRLLPLELFVPLLVHSPLLDLAIQMAYRSPVLEDRELHRLIARPARQAGAIHALRAMSMAMALRPQRATAPSLLKRLRHPMLLIWGENDWLVPLEVGWQCQRFQGTVALTVVAEAGHCPHDEKAAAFNALVISWLGSLSMPEASGPRASDGPREHVP